MSVTLAEAKLHARLTTGTAEDALVTQKVAAAVAHIERITGIALSSQTFQKLSKTVTAPVRLTPHPVTAVTAIEVVPATGTARNVASLFDVDLTGRPGIVRLVDSLELARGETLRVTFTAGFAAWPVEIEEAVLQLAAHWYENRSAVVTGTASAEVQHSVTRLITPWLGLRLA